MKSGGEHFFFHDFLVEFTGNPVNDVAILGLGTCFVPDMTVSKVACAASLKHTVQAGGKAAARTNVKREVEKKRLSEAEAKEAYALIDAGDTLISVATLDPEKGLVGLPEISALWKTANTYIEFVNLPGSPGAQVSGTSTPQRALSLTATFQDSPQVVNCAIIPVSTNAPPEGKGMLDLAICLDVSGSMMDDLQTIHESAGPILDTLRDYSRSNNISLQVGMLLYTRHDEPNWLRVVSPLTGDVNRVRDAIKAINITDPALGKGGNEDLYGALLYAMNEQVAGKQVNLGWRTNAAKLAIPIGDETPDDPDWDKHTLDDVARVAKALDPVHMYPLLTPKQANSFLAPAASAMEKLAEATDGKVIRVDDAKKLPKAIVDTVKLAVRRHKDEVWRKTHPPYLLYGAGAALSLLALVVILAASLSHRRRLNQLRWPPPPPGAR